MDRLTNEEKALAWSAAWYPSFDGTAIINADGVFRSANPQFCKLLGVTPADLVGENFRDITPGRIKKLEHANMELLRDGAIQFYVLPKKFQFSHGHTVNVILLMTRVPQDNLIPLKFFMARVMVNEKGASFTHKAAKSKSVFSCLKPIARAVEFAAKYAKIIFAAGAFLAGLIYTAWDYINR